MKKHNGKIVFLYGEYHTFDFLPYFQKWHPDITCLEVPNHATVDVFTVYVSQKKPKEILLSKIERNGSQDTWILHSNFLIDNTKDFNFNFFLLSVLYFYHHYFLEPDNRMTFQEGKDRICTRLFFLESNSDITKLFASNRLQSRRLFLLRDKESQFLI